MAGIYAPCRPWLEFDDANDGVLRHLFGQRDDRRVAHFGEGRGTPTSALNHKGYRVTTNHEYIG
jgi:hypothetical protein